MKSVVHTKIRVLLLASYCGGANENCTEDSPCIECLKMCNIFDIRPPIEMEYVSELGYVKVKKDEIMAIKRYNLGIPQVLYDSVKELADKEGTSALEIFKKLMMIGLVLYKKQKEPGTAIIIKQELKEDVEVIFP